MSTQKSLVTIFAECKPNGYIVDGLCVCDKFWAGPTCRDILCDHGVVTTGLVQDVMGHWVHGPLCECYLPFDGRHCDNRNLWLLLDNRYVDKVALIAVTVLVFCAGATFISYMMYKSRQERDDNEEELFIGRTQCTMTEAGVQTDPTSVTTTSSTVCMTSPATNAACRAVACLSTNNSDHDDDYTQCHIITV